MDADPEKIPRPAGRSGKPHEQAHLPGAGRHAEGEHGQPRRQTKHGIEHRAQEGAARAAARHAQHVKQQPQHRAERQRKHELAELRGNGRVHPPNRRDQKPPPDAVSSV